MIVLVGFARDGMFDHVFCIGIQQLHREVSFDRYPAFVVFSSTAIHTEHDELFQKCLYNKLKDALQQHFLRELDLIELALVVVCGINKVKQSSSALIFMRRFRKATSACARLSATESHARADWRHGDA